MSNIFITSDLHVGHIGVIKFLNNDGTKLRPWDTVEEMDEALIKNWNAVVRPKDKVYNLGDVVINRKALPTLARLNGEKILIKGNHDGLRLEEYTPYFSDIRGVGSLDGFVLTHIPVHPVSIGRWTGNFHGHLHSNRVAALPFDLEYSKFMPKHGFIDKRYLCLCVEHTNFQPIALEDAKKLFKGQQ